MTKKKRNRLILIIILSILFVLFLIDAFRPRFLPPELAELTAYSWTVQQEVTEPNVYRFRKNGKVRIFNFSSEKICRWSFKNGKLRIWRNSLFDAFDKTVDIKIEWIDGEIYLHLGNGLLKGYKIQS